MAILSETSDFPSNSATSALILAGDTLYGRVSSPQDRDWVAVDLVAGQTYSLAAVGVGRTPLSDVSLRLLGPVDATIVAENDDGLPNMNALIIQTVAQTGRYFVEVAGMRSLQGDYGLTLAKGSRPDFEVPLIAGVILDSQSIWPSKNLTYGFRQSGNDGRTIFGSPFSDAQQTSIFFILAHYAEIANLTFTEDSARDQATLLFANYNQDDGRGAYAYGPGTNPVNGDVWFNMFYGDGTYEFGGTFYEIMLHEIGHAMGLTHPGLYDAGNGVDLTYANSAQFTQDSESLTLLSYFEASATGGSNVDGQTLSIADILALQNAYGANMETRATDTTYGFGGEGIYNFNNNPTPKLTIWDGGGIDTIDLSDESASQRINLNEGTLSDVMGLLRNLGIAIGAKIENAFGGNGADTILGNDLNNDLRGGGGVDLLFGGAGRDTLNGNAEADILVGGAGDDLFFVDNADDRILEGTGGGYDIVQTTVSYRLGSGSAVQELRATGGGTINLTGNASANRLVADTGLNSLTGGAGRDVFVFNFGSSTTGLRDTITDFTQGLDRLDLSGMDANLGSFGDQAFASLGTNAAANRLWWQTQGSDLILRGDVDGNTSADFEVLIRNLSSLTTNDIIL